MWRLTWKMISKMIVATGSQKLIYSLIANNTFILPAFSFEKNEKKKLKITESLLCVLERKVLYS